MLAFECKTFPLIVYDQIDINVNVFYFQKEASVQHLYLGRNPPLITDIRVLRQCDDDHLVCDILKKHLRTMCCSASA